MIEVIGDPTLLTQAIGFNKLVQVCGKSGQSTRLAEDEVTANPQSFNFVNHNILSTAPLRYKLHKIRFG